MLRYQIFFINFFALILFIFDRLLKNHFHSQNQFYPNSGFAFGFSLTPILLCAIVLIILLILIFLLIRSYSPCQLCFITAYSFILAGAISNLCDRFIYGYVIDYINFIPTNVFNLADILIFVGVALLFCKIFFFSRHNQNSNQC